PSRRRQIRDPVRGRPARVTPCLSFLLHVPPPTDLYTLSLHDALPIYRIDGGQSTHTADRIRRAGSGGYPPHTYPGERRSAVDQEDRKSTRLNSSHVKISYAVFCLKKKKTRRCTPTRS